MSAPERRGFGTIVTETMAERSVDGTVDLDYAPSGVTWRLTSPAVNALEPYEGRTGVTEMPPPRSPLIGEHIRAIGGPIAFCLC